MCVQNYEPATKLMALTNDRKQDDEKNQKKKDVNNWLRALKQLSQNPAGKKNSTV